MEKALYPNTIKKMKGENQTAQNIIANNTNSYKKSS